MSDVTKVLQAIRMGDAEAASLLLPLVYKELRQMARYKLAQERPGQTLEATGLVHEAYLRLVGEQGFENRRHFFGAAAEAMRRILIENARRKSRVKHGGHLHRESFDPAFLISPTTGEEILALDRALDRLAVEHPRKARLVELRFFGGLTSDEAAEILDISASTAHRDWVFARAWIHRAMSDDVDVPKIANVPPSSTLATSEGSSPS